MIKSELVARLAEENPHLFQRDVERIVNTIFDEISGALSRGDRVEKLLFEYYPGMAEEQLEKLRLEAMERHGLTDMKILHRSGELLPGDNIVLILAASEHRAAAFEAAAWCIAELKERVPVWKKEYTRSGQVWVDGGASR